MALRKLLWPGAGAKDGAWALREVRGARVGVVGSSLTAKLDIMTKAYESELSESIEAVKREGMPDGARAAEIKRMQSEVESLVYRLKRGSSQFIKPPSRR